MTKIEISLPDDVKEMAERQGLLDPAILEGLLREEMLRRRSLAELVAMAKTVAAQNEPLTEKEIQAFVQSEIKTYRTERRAANAGRS